MKTLKFTILCGLTLCLHACKDSGMIISEAELSANYVRYYITPKSMGVDARIYAGTIYFHTWFYGLHISRHSGEAYEALTKQYNDLTYNEYVMVHGGPSAVNDSIANVSLTCDKDYNAQYPAGSELAGIVQVESLFPCKLFIANNYDGKLTEKYIPHLMSEVTPANSGLFSPRIVFSIAPLPPAGEYTFTMKVQLSNQTLTRSTTIQVPNP